MLSTPAPFPQVGAHAFLRGTGDAVRILRRHANGTSLISIERPRPLPPTTRTVPQDDLFAERREAVRPVKAGRGAPMIGAAMAATRRSAPRG